MTPEERAVAERDKDLIAARRARNTAKHRKWFDKVKNTDEFRDKANAIARRSYAARKQREAIAVSGGVKPDICDVCQEAGRICFDHCHASKKFRGWLCNHCNLILGHAKDNPQRLRALANYLEGAS